MQIIVFKSYNNAKNVFNIMVSANLLVNTYNSHPNKAMEPTEPFQEAIYDFGGANVKSCASIALSKSISKGLIPPGQWTTLSNQNQNLNHQANNIPANFRGSYFKIFNETCPDSSVFFLYIYVFELSKPSFLLYYSYIFSKFSTKKINFNLQNKFVSSIV